MEDDPKPKPSKQASSAPQQSGLGGLWSELKRRHVVRVAMVYAIVGWLVIQVANATFSDFDIPVWAYRFVVLMVVLGFPISMVLAWAFELTPEGIKTSKTAREEHPEAHKDASHAKKRNWMAVAFAASMPTLIFGALALIFYIQVQSSHGPPVVILLDTPAPKGVYDPETRSASATNADDLNNALRDLPVVLHKETLNSIWDRENQVLKQRPALIVIHRSGFFHSMNQEFNFGYPDDSSGYSEQDYRRLYAVAENKLLAFFGYIGLGNSNTNFFVYSRGKSPGWAEESYRSNWVAGIEGRFPLLADRIFTMNVPGGNENASFRDEETLQIIRQNIRSILGLKVGELKD